jgi:hypothetical protein
MNVKSVLTATLLGGFLGVTMSAALAAPVMLGPGVTPMLPKVMAVPIVPVKMGPQLLATYRQVRTFWLSRAVVR